MLTCWLDRSDSEEVNWINEVKSDWIEMKSLFMAMSAQTSGREPQYPPSSSPPTIQPARPLTVTVSQTFTITVLLREDRRKFVQGLIEAVLKKLWWALPFVFVCVCPSWSSPLSYLKLLCLFWEIQPCHCSLLPCFVLVLLPSFWEGPW